MKLIKKIRKLCTPAYVYLVISVIAILAMMLQNGGHNRHFCIGEYGCDVESKGAIFIGQGLYTAFWVFVLDSICKSGHKNISWFLVLLPYVLMFIALGMIVLGGKHRETIVEGLKNKQHDDDKNDDDKKHNKTHDKNHDKKHDKTHDKTHDKKSLVEGHDTGNKCGQVYHIGTDLYSDSTCKNTLKAV